MADGQQGQGGQQQFNANDYYLKQQAARMLSAIQKGYNDNFQTSQQQQVSTNAQPTQVSLYMNQQQSQQQQTQQQQVQQQQTQQQQQPQQQAQQQVQQQQSQQQNQQQQQQQQQQGSSTSHHMQVQHQQLQQQLQQVQQAQQQFQQMQHLAQMQQQFQQQYTTNNVAGATAGQLTQNFGPTRRGRKPNEKRKRKRHTYVKRPTTAYLYFVSKYRETLKEAGEVVPKAKIITQACAEKWRHMTEEEKEPFLELARRDRQRWQVDKSLEKKPRDPNRPKRPPSAYFLFLADFRKSYPNKTDPAKEITKKAGTSWNSLTDQEKTPYYRNAQVERAKWEVDLEAYKSKQVKPGQMQMQQQQNQMQQMSQQQKDNSDMSSSSPGTPLQGNSNMMSTGMPAMTGSIAAVTSPHSPTSNPVMVSQSTLDQGNAGYIYSQQMLGNNVQGNNLHFMHQDEYLTSHSEADMNE